MAWIMNQLEGAMASGYSWDEGNMRHEKDLLQKKPILKCSTLIDGLRSHALALRGAEWL
jgi:hypothetical protein